MMRRLTPAVAFLATVVAANYATSSFGFVPVGFGLTATAGTYLAGLAFVLRDATQDTIGRTGATTTVVAGAALSYLIADPTIALASGAAFLVSELTDLAAYTPLRRRGYIRAAVASNLVGSVVDTWVFLTVAGFGGVLAAMPGQLVGKLTITAVVVAGVLACRARVAAMR